MSYTLRPEIDFSGHIEPLAPSLSLDQRFRLIEIAHETSNSEVRSAALRMLKADQLYVAVGTEQ